MSDLVATLRNAGCVFAEEEAALLIASASDDAELAAMTRRRCGGEPLEYVVGWAQFADLRIGVDPGVFIPRRRTEFLARQASALIDASSTAVDMCCGAGAIGAFLMRAHPGLSLYAADIDSTAVQCARRNLPGATVVTGDLFAPLPDRLRGRVDVVVANVPYVPRDHIAMLPSEARDYEPLATLDGGHDGLRIADRVVHEARDWLRVGGHVLVEVSDRQAEAAVGLLETNGYTARIIVDDDLAATVAIGQVT